MSENIKGFTINVTMGRDEVGRLSPMIVVQIDEQKFGMLLTRADAIQLAMDILAAEAQSGGRTIVPVMRKDGNPNA